jgi:hypothetical protein
MCWIASHFQEEVSNRTEKLKMSQIPSDFDFQETWSGMEWNGVEWNGIECNGME